MDDAYAPVARYYHREYQSYREDLPLYEYLARRLGSPFLELGCGSGRITRLLLEMGLSGVAIDSSSAMLDLAAKHLDRWITSGQVRLVQADARSLGVVSDGPFAWAFFGLSTFAHLLSTEEQLAALASVAGHVISGGRIVVDMPEPFSSFPFEGAKTPEVQWVDVDMRLMKLVYRVPRFEDQAEDVTVIYEDWSHQGKLERVATRFRLRYLFPGEARLLAGMAGLAVEAVYGNYALEPFGADSDRLILVLRKP
jgi:SAM-dependent methyltransferase